MQLAEKAIGLYKGHFLPGDEEETWTVSYRERLRNKFLRLITKLGDSLQKTGQWESALEYYQKGLEVDDLAEEFYQGLMICHQHLGAISEAVKTYRNCQKVLSAVLGVEPSPITEKIYKRNDEAGESENRGIVSRINRRRERYLGVSFLPKIKSNLLQDREPG